MAFKSSDSQNSEGRNRGGKDQKKKMKKVRSIKLPKMSSLNSSSRRATWQFDLSAIDLAIEELNSIESSDAKKESFEGESESEYASVSSSSSPLNLDSNVKEGAERKKALKKSRSTKLGRFGSFRPSKRKPESRRDQHSITPQQQTPVQFSEASPDYSKPKSRSDMPSMRILKSKASFRSRRPLMKKQSEMPKDLYVKRATCSSTLKDSKFSKEIELHEGENEIDRISVMKVCPYHHCSLHGHCHGPEPVPKKPFLRRKKHSMKIQKSKEIGDEKKGSRTSKRRENEDRDVGEILFGRKSQSEKILRENDFTVETEPRPMSSSGASQENEDRDVGGILFGRKSLPEKSFQENLYQTRNFPAPELNSPISSSTKCHPFNEISASREEKNGYFVQESESNNGSTPITVCDSKELKPVEDSKAYSAGQEVNHRLKKENSISMWHLIHRQMVSSLKEDVEENRVGDPNTLVAKRSLSRNISDADAGNEETEIRKIFAIKLVREAIEKILLPEVQDQSSDDQSVTSEVISEENFGKNHDEGGEVMISNSTDSAKQEKIQQNGDEEEKTARKEDGKSEKRAPKSWSYLKKVILLKRFVKELQKVREFTPRKPRYLPSEPDQEAEKVSLRPQITSEKKNSEEWMLDYAIRQVVSELEPKQKKKVALLVKAFETVAPPNEDQPIKAKVHKLRDNSQESTGKDQEGNLFPESNEVDNVVLASNSDLSEQITEAQEGKNRDFEPEDVIEENGAVSSSSNRHPFEEVNGKMEEKKGDPKEECESINGPTLIKDSADPGTGPQALKSGFKKENHISMWHLIHKQMVSGLAAESGIESLCAADEEMRVDDVNTLSVNNDNVNQETEMRKMFAIKLVREAIEKILLPEVQDQSSDDQSTKSDVSSDQHLNEKNHNEDFEKINFSEHEGNNMGGDRSFEVEESREDNNEEEKTERKEGYKSEKQKPKSWSFLKKIILLKRFVKELEKVKKFNPKKPQLLPLQPDQEAEKVSLRPQMTSEKRNTDEWMLDYAIRQVVSELAPKQKKKVALLVKAFETVAPPNEDQPIKVQVRKLKDNSQESTEKDQDGNLFPESDEVDNVVLTSNCDLSVQITEAQEGKNRKFEPEDVIEESGAVSSSSNRHPFEEVNGKAEEQKGDPKEECESINGPTLIKDSADSGTGPRALKSRFKKENHISMWHLIHKQMVSGLSAESGTESLCAADEEKRVDDVNTLSVNNDNVNQETEMRKMFAIKLVREAIEKILLPEVQDRSSDDQSTTSDVSSDQHLNEKNHDEDFEKLNFSEREGNNMGGDRSFVVEEENGKNEEEKTERKEGNNSEKQKPKSWSYLKKVILLKRFVKELEKVKKFNPKKPQLLPLQPDQEAEKVSLRPQMVGEKRSTDEWMLDYAVRQVVSELAPTQKRKVALLVKAFETVAPPNEDHSNNCDGGSKSSRKIVGPDDLPDIESNVSENIVSSTNSKPSEQVNEEREEKSRGFGSESIVIGEDKTLAKDKQNNIKMWHMIYQHVVSGIAEKVGTKLLLDGGDEDEQVENAKNLRNYEVGDKELEETSQRRLEFSKSDAVKLVQEAVDEILDDSSETQSTSGDSITTPEDNQSATGDITATQEDGKERVEVRKQKSKNWSKLKKLILLKRSIKALENTRKRDPQPPKLLPLKGDVEKEKVDLRSQMVDERKKAEQWMLDYAVQHIVTKLTPARKRRVAMLVEAFEAVVPLPEI